MFVQRLQRMIISHFIGLLFFFKSLKFNRHQNSALAFEDKDEVMPGMKNRVGEKIDVAIQGEKSGILLSLQK